MATASTSTPGSSDQVVSVADDDDNSSVFDASPSQLERLYVFGHHWPSTCDVVSIATSTSSSSPSAAATAASTIESDSKSHDCIDIDVVVSAWIIRMVWLFEKHSAETAVYLAPSRVTVDLNPENMDIESWKASDLHRIASFLLMWIARLPVQLANPTATANGNDDGASVDSVDTRILNATDFRKTPLYRRFSHIIHSSEWSVTVHHLELASCLIDLLDLALVMTHCLGNDAFNVIGHKHDSHLRGITASLPSDQHTKHDLAHGLMLVDIARTALDLLADCGITCPSAFLGVALECLGPFAHSCVTSEHEALSGSTSGVAGTLSTLASPQLLNFPLSNGFTIVESAIMLLTADTVVAHQRLQTIFRRIAEWPPTLWSISMLLFATHSMKQVRRYSELHRMLSTTVPTALIHMKRLACVQKQRVTTVVDDDPVPVHRPLVLLKLLIRQISAMILGAYEPLVFHKNITLLMRIATLLSPTATGAISANNDLWLSYCGLIQCLVLHVFPGYPQLYQPLLTAIDRCLPLPNNEALRIVQQYSWVLRPKANSIGWVEGEWRVSYFGKLNLIVQSEFAGLFVRGENYDKNVRMDGVLARVDNADSFEFAGAWCDAKEQKQPMQVMMRSDGNVENLIGSLYYGEEVVRNFMAMKAQRQTQPISISKFAQMSMPLLQHHPDVDKFHANRVSTPLAHDITERHKLFGSWREPGTLPVGTWLPKTGTGRMPVERYGSTALGVNDTIFVLGGNAANINIMCQDVHSYVDGLWRVHTPSTNFTPPGRMHGSGFVSGHYLYWFGGQTSNGLRLNDMWRFSLNSLQWTQIGPTEDHHFSVSPFFEAKGNSAWPSPRSYHAMAQLTEVDIWMFGGQSPPNLISGMVPYNNELWSFSPTTRQWKLTRVRGRVPQARYGHSLVACNGYLWLFGGISAAHHALNDLWFFDVSTLTWTMVHDTERLPSGAIPAPRVLHTSVATEDGIYIAFGSLEKNNMWPATNEIWCYWMDSKRPEAGRWIPCTPLGGSPDARHSHCTALVRSPMPTLITFGGTDAANKPRKDLWGIKIVQRHDKITQASPHAFVPLMCFHGPGYIDVGASKEMSFEFVRPFTFEACIRSTNHGRVQTVIAKRDRTRWEWELVLDHLRRPLFSRRCEPFKTEAKNSVSRKFVMVSVAYDGTNVRLYVDGALQKTVAMGAVINDDVTPMLIGASHNDVMYQNFFDGNIVEVRMWDVARPVERIAAYAHQSLLGTEQNLVGYWRLYGDSGPMPGAFDLSGNGHAGRLDMAGIRTVYVPQSTLNMESKDMHQSQPHNHKLFMFYGAASLRNSSLMLTRDLPHRPNVVVLPEHSIGSVWFRRKVAIRRGFSMTIHTTLLPSQWGGFAVLLQSFERPSSVQIGKSGQGCGYGGVQNAIAVAVTFGDEPADRIISVSLTDVEGVEMPLESAAISCDSTIELGVDYDCTSLRVFVNGTEALAVAMDLSSVLSMDAEHAWLGLTATSQAIVAVNQLVFEHRNILCEALAAESKRDPAACSFALRHNNDDVTQAEEMMERLSDEELLKLRHAKYNRIHLSNRLVHSAATTGVHDDHLRLLAIIGHWESVSRRKFTVTWENVAPIRGYQVCGTYLAGMFRGSLFRSRDLRTFTGGNLQVEPLVEATKTAASGIYAHDDSWVLVGMYRPNHVRTWQPMRLFFDKDFSQCSGSWIQGDKCGTVTGTKVVPNDNGAMHKKGLHNLGNTCYMNSFLQALFMTSPLRDAVVRHSFRHSFKLYPGSVQGMTAVATSEVFTVRKLQELFTNMLLSKRPNISPHNFQESLAPLWRGPQQQDSSEFGTYLIDVISEGLKAEYKWMETSAAESSDMADDACAEADIAAGLATPLRSDSAFQRESFGLFDGRLTNVIRCANCDKRTLTHEDFKTLPLHFPEQYRPITDIRVVCGEELPPPGFTKEFAELYSPAKDLLPAGVATAPIYICHAREKDRDPVTSIIVIHGKSGESKGLSTPADILQQVPDGYSVVPVNLNPAPAAENAASGDAEAATFSSVYLAFSRDDQYGSPITAISTLSARQQALQPPATFHLVKPPLNPNGDLLYLCVSSAGCPIVDVKIVSGDAKAPGPVGYQRIPLNLCLTHYGYRGFPSNDVEAPTHTFLCYKRGQRAPITELDLVYSREESEARIANGYDVHGISVSNTANDEPRRVYMCTKRGDGCPVDKIHVFRGRHAPSKFGDIQRFDIADETKHSQDSISGCWSVDWLHSLQMAVVPDSARSVRRVNGVYGPGRSLSGILYVDHESKRWCSTGTVEEKQYKQRAVYKLEFSADCAEFTGTIVFADKVEQFWAGKHVKLPSLPPGSRVVRMTAPTGASIHAEVSGTLSSLDIPHDPQWDLFVLEDLGHDAIAIRSHHGKYLAGRADAGSVSCSSAVVTELCYWYLDNDQGQSATYVIRSLTGMLLCIDNTGFTCKESTDELAAAQRFALVDIAAGVDGDGSDAIAGVWEFEHHKLLLTVQEAQVVQSATGIVLSPFESERLFASDQTGLAELLDADGKRKPDAENASHIALDGDVTELSNSRFQFDGIWRSIGKHEHGQPLSIIFNLDTGNVSGWYVRGDGRHSISGRKDTYVSIGVVHNYSEEWKAGEQTCSSVAAREDLDSLIHNFLRKQVMDGKNKYRCSSDTCGGALVRAEQYVRISRAPQHLLVNLKRFQFDYLTGAHRKILSDIDIPVVLNLPVHPTDVDERQAGMQRSASAETLAGVEYGLDDPMHPAYALYAVIIHSGSSADVGHYYCYARESTAPGLLEPESPYAPWYRFEDDNVRMSSFAELQGDTNRSPRNSAYLLFYCRVTPEHPAYASAHGSDSDDDEVENLLLTPALKLRYSPKLPSETLSLRLAAGVPRSVFAANEQLYTNEIAKQHTRMYQAHISNEVQGLAAADVIKSPFFYRTPSMVRDATGLTNFAVSARTVWGVLERRLDPGCRPFCMSILPTEAGAYVEGFVSCVACGDTISANDACLLQFRPQNSTMRLRAVQLLAETCEVVTFANENDSKAASEPEPLALWRDEPMSLVGLEAGFLSLDAAEAKQASNIMHACAQADNWVVECPFCSQLMPACRRDHHIQTCGLQYAKMLSEDEAAAERQRKEQEERERKEQEEKDRKEQADREAATPDRPMEQAPEVDGNRQPPPPPPPELVVCPICQKGFKTVREVQEHVPLCLGGS
jgi:ubiquitin C-terminal hydrolase